MAIDLLSYFPYSTPRPIQGETIRVLQEAWDNYDTFVISAPTAWGKTALSRTLMSALHSVSVITPTNQLVRQFVQEFPETRKLSRLDSYHCEEWDRPCSVTRNKLLQFCRGCECGADLSTAKYRNGPGVYNYHIYLAHKLYRDVLVVDEAHNLIPVLQDRNALCIWQHDYQYPDNMYSNEQVVAWLRSGSLTPTRRRHKKIQALIGAVTHEIPQYVIRRDTRPFNGKGTLRGRPEQRDCLLLLPVDISGAPPVFWPAAVGKRILLSATIGRKDIQALGLDTGRVLYINAESPIPAGNRPVVRVPLVSVNRGNLEQSAAAIAQYIDQVIIPQHRGQKGVIHATYQLSRLLRTHLLGQQYLFHTAENKASVYEQFRSSPPESGTVLIASGMYEGIDLPEDLGRWQLIAKVPWQSLGSPAIRYMSDADPEWYAWSTIRTLIQACGRVCRTPEDYGITIILDSSVEKLFNEYQHLLPEWYRDALLEGNKLL